MITYIVDPSHVGEARRAAGEFARRAGGDERQVGRVAIVATEMATNIVKHAGGNDGMLHISRFSDAEGAGVEIVAIDRGPGMDVNVCLADGYSTAGSAGTGLGAISRQADRFVVYSRTGNGTVISARFVFEAPAKTRAAAEIGFVGDTYPGETVSGDNWAFHAGGHGPTLMVVDGSGHGPLAARAADLATEIFTEHAHEDCVSLVERMHRALAPTRGAAVAVARVDVPARVVRFVGVGNIAGTLLNGAATRQMVSNNGTAGHIAPRIREFTYPIEAALSLVVMHSDGLSNRWKTADYPGLAACHPSLVAGVLFRDFRRGRDDATVAVMRPR